MKSEELTKEEREEVWMEFAKIVLKRLDYWKKHNPKKYREFWREYRKLEKAFSEDLK